MFALVPNLQARKVSLGNSGPAQGHMEPRTSTLHRVLSQGAPLLDNLVPKGIIAALPSHSCRHLGPSSPTASPKWKLLGWQSPGAGGGRPRRAVRAVPMMPAIREAPRCKDTQLISCQERCKLWPGPSPTISPGIALCHRMSPHDKRKYVQSRGTNKRRGGSQRQRAADCL